VISLTPPDWSLPIEALAAAIGPKTRGIVLNSPNNPVGTMLSRQTLEAIGEFAENHDLWVLCDEVWEAMVFDGTPHVSPLAIPSLAERSVKVGSAGKIFSMTGWKVGWVVAAPALAARIAAKHQFLTFTTPPALQWAAAEGLVLPDSWFDAQRARYAALKARLVSGLEAAGFIVLPASGTWFVTLDLAASGLPADDVKLSERLVREARVASIPVSAFYTEAPERGYLRLCFTKAEEVLDEAVRRLAAFRAGLT
jgi:N-succinyldiaminopimelate aminotransferase